MADEAASIRMVPIVEHDSKFNVIYKLFVDRVELIKFNFHISRRFFEVLCLFLDR